MIKFKFIEKIPPFLRNRYLLTIIIFFVWLLLLDSNNLISRIREMRNLRELNLKRSIMFRGLKKTKGNFTN